MKFSMFFIAEYANMATVSALTATLFFGGWDIPFTAWDNAGPHTVLKTAATLAAFGVKTGAFLFLFMWIRWTLPRFRYDQLMALGWSLMLPLALGYIVLVAALVLALDAVGVARGPGFSLALFAVNVALLAALGAWLDRGRIISPASARLGGGELARRRARAVPRAAAAPPAAIPAPHAPAPAADGGA
jgi:NADH-quinone oxidoreductase subunit H